MRIGSVPGQLLLKTSLLKTGLSTSSSTNLTLTTLHHPLGLFARIQKASSQLYDILLNQTIRVAPWTLFNIGISDSATPEESKSHLATLYGLALVFESGVIGNVILSRYLKETLTPTRGAPRRSLRLSTT